VEGGEWNGLRRDMMGWQIMGMKISGLVALYKYMHWDYGVENAYPPCTNFVRI
jgi:hypothetical protein